MGPYAGVDYNLALCDSQHMYHGQPYAGVDLNPMPKSTLSPSQSGTWIWPPSTGADVTESISSKKLFYFSFSIENIV
jgi:hypothetical protein